MKFNENSILINIIIMQVFIVLHHACIIMLDYILALYIPWFSLDLGYKYYILLWGGGGGGGGDHFNIRRA